jgi:DtxR family Mn-dependent transcriptional regulator
MGPTDQLSASLEDYLETIYELVRDQKVARVRDIARARGVRAASVTPALRRLVELELIDYEKRGFIDLTPEGQRQAQRIFSRHQVLKRFFDRVLKMPAASAAGDACAMEHSLSPEGMDYMVRFLEFLNNCPEGQRFLDLFHHCASCQRPTDGCRTDCPLQAGRRGEAAEPTTSVASLAPGSRARVVQIMCFGELRDRLLDMGLLPDVMVEVAGVTQTEMGAERFNLRVQGFELRLSGEEARAVRVAAPEESP